MWKLEPCARSAHEVVCILSVTEFTPATAPPIAPRAAFEEQPSEITDIPTRPYRVLLVEDNAADVMIVEEILAAQPVQFEIVLAIDGQEAIRILEALDGDASLPGFDITLLDLNLPKHTGHEVLAELRKSHRSRHMPVIIVTSSRSPSDMKRAKELGATEYFEKVSDLDAYSALGSLVVQTIRRSRSAQ